MTNQKELISLAASYVYGAKYDEAVKQTMRLPKIIAPILKAVVPEYKDFTCEEVVQFIVRDSINDDPVDDTSIIANQLDTEMSSISDKLIRYDSRFKAINPKLSDKEIDIHLHIDLEIQNDYKPSNPSYPIIKRALYYGARELSSQLGVLTSNTNYDKLEKAYSIWICNENVPSEIQNTVTSYKIIKTDEIGVAYEPERDYDLLNVIIIRRGDDSSDEEIFDYLEAYFKGDIERLSKYIDIENDENLKKGVEKMPVDGMGQALFLKVESQAYAKGQTDKLVELVKKGLLQIVDAAKEAEMSEEEFSKLLYNK